jgi:hypothetical protein
MHTIIHMYYTHVSQNTGALHMYVQVYVHMYIQM